MRVALAGFMHESNTFVTWPTRLTDFTIHREQALIKHYAPTFHELAGFIAGAAAFNFQPVPLLAANATPGGALTRDTYDKIVTELLTALRHAGPIDGLLLALHGAMVAEDFPQADAETVRRVRQIIGPDLPLMVTHDYHGNVPQSLVDDVDALIVYKTNPHIDQRERGLQAAQLMARTIRGEVRPVCALHKPPLLFNIAFHNTSRPPMQALMRRAIVLEAEPGILACNIAAGYQYADVPAMGPSVVVVSDGNREQAQQEAERLGQMMWQIRDQLIPELPDAAAAVAEAMRRREKPVALFDLGDNIGGGSAGDATILLLALLEQGAQDWVMSLYDPEAAAACHQAGVGASISLEVGGKVDDLHGPPVAVQGQIRTLHDGSFTETERRHGGGRHFNQGLTAVLTIEHETGSRGLLLLNSKRTPPMSLHQITSAGIQPQQQQILVVKGAVAPRAAYEPVCADIIEVDTPGATAISQPPTAYRLASRERYEWTRSA